LHRRSHRGLSGYRQDALNDGKFIHVDGSGTIVGSGAEEDPYLLFPRYFNRLTIDDVEAQGDTIENCFAIGIHCESVLGAFISKASFVGGFLTSNTQLNYGTAFKFDGDGLPVSPHLTDTSIYRAFKALDVLHHEGIIVQGFEWVAVNQGVYWRVTGTGLKPHLAMNNGHISSFERGINAEYLSQSTIKNIDFYKRIDSTNAAHTQIQLNHCFGVTIGGNTFQGGSDNVSNGVIVQDSDHTILETNMFQSGKTTWNFDANCAGTVRLPQKVITANWTTPGGIDSGTGTQVVNWS
jgi:hypothetical protein